MGCSTSRDLEAHTENAGKRQMVDGPYRHPQSADDYHLVALTSTTYGILKLDSQKQADESCCEEADPVKQMYERIKAIDENKKEDVAPQSWSELSNVLVKLTNDAQRTTAKPNPGNGLAEPEIMNTWELEEGVEEKKQVPNSAVDAPVEKPQAGPRRTFATIHTIEELDKIESSLSMPESISSRDMLEHHSGVEKHDTTPNVLLSNLKSPPSRLSSYPLSLGNTSPPKLNENASKGFVKSSILKLLFRHRHSSMTASSSPSKIARKKLAPRSSVDPSSENCDGRDILKPPKSSGSHYLSDEKRSPSNPMWAKSDLFDEEFLASFQEACEKLSEDEWNSVSIEKENTFLGGKKGATFEATRTDSTLPGNKTFEGDQLGAQAHMSTVVVTPIKDVQGLPAATFRGKIIAQDPVQQYEVNCPPDGEQSVVLYSTSLHGIRKTFEDCNVVRIIVQSFGIHFDERDVSLHSEFKQELKNLFEKPMAVPRLFIKGRYIGGAEEVLTLHENGTLQKLLNGVPLNPSKAACDGCGGVRFMPCTDCSGSCKMVTEHGKVARCTECNENGLIKCPICS